jgi:hypothetical protein
MKDVTKLVHDSEDDDEDDDVVDGPTSFTYHVMTDNQAQTLNSMSQSTRNSKKRKECIETKKDYTFNFGLTQELSSIQLANMQTLLNKFFEANGMVPKVTSGIDYTLDDEEGLDNDMDDEGESDDSDDSSVELENKQTEQVR